MRLALNIGYLTGRDRPADALALVRHAEQLGFDSVWAAEAYGVDCVSILAWLAGQLDRINIGSAVMQIPGRTPAMTAMTAAGLDAVSGGRFRLGLGVSGPQVAEGWHGRPFARPLARTREYVGIVRKALAGEVVASDGEHYPLPLPGGAGKPLKLMARPLADRVPILLAAVGPRNLELAGEIADGWQGIFYAPDLAADQFAAIDAGLARAGRARAGFDARSPDAFQAMANVPLSVGDDVAACADRLRPGAALYVGGMGSRKQNFYNDQAVRMGYRAEAATIQDLYLAGDQRAAARAVPQELIERTSLVGDAARVSAQLAALAASGLTTCAVTPAGSGVEEKMAQLDALAEAYAGTGLAQAGNGGRA